MTAENNKEKNISHIKHRKLIIVLSVILSVIILAVSFFLIFLKVGESSLRKKGEQAKPQLPTSGESYSQTADAYYNGEAYNYKDKLINILLLGIDRNNPNSSNKHQADALYLISLDTETKKTTVIAISRNTLVDVDAYDISGNYISTNKQQICLSYTYSKDNKKASENTVKSVSRLFYGLPINGYYTIFMNSVGDIVDAVGGVPVNITEDMTKIHPSMKQGANITLTGDKALKYLQFRGASNAPRLERQKAFIRSFVSRAKSACLKDLSLPMEMYNKLANNTITDVTAASATYLASEAIKADFEILGIEGVSGSDGVYETFEPNEDGLYQLILNVFYKKQ